jgi:hypothetical protein
MLECVYTMKCPYTMETKKKYENMYQKIISKYNDTEHIPDFALVYAGVMKLLPVFSKKPSCYFCKNVVCIQGIVYPIDTGLLVPIPICHKCGCNEKEIKINNVVCDLKHYTWKMILNASISERIYEKIIEEEEKEKKMLIEEIEYKNGNEFYMDLGKNDIKENESYILHFVVTFFSIFLLIFFLVNK